MHGHYVVSPILTEINGKRAYTKLGSCSQFHHHFTISFLPISFRPKITNIIFKESTLRKTCLHEKAARKMLVKLTP